MKPTSIQCHNDSLEFIFNQHEVALRKLAANWFVEKLASATSEERHYFAERVLVRGEEVGRDLAVCRFLVSLQRTLRVPDDGRDYPLPAGLGRLPIRNVRALKAPAIPAEWRTRATGLACLHPAEATWLSFGGDGLFAVQVAAGTICAVSGTVQEKSLVRDPQNYVVTPDQPWLDGFRVSPEVVRQFVAMPLGKGFSVEQQVTGAETTGGLQLRVVPPKVEFLWEEHVRERCEWRWIQLITRPCIVEESSVKYCVTSSSSSLGAGGRIKQKIYADPHPAGTWDEAAAVTCDLQLIDARHWSEFTGEVAPTKPPTPQLYAQAGIPWFDYENSSAVLTGTSPLADIKSVATLFTEKTGMNLPENDLIEISGTIKLGS